MNKLTAALCLLFSITACSTTSQPLAGDPPEYFAKLSEKEAEDQLTKVQGEIEELDKEIRGAETRRDSARMKQGTDASKESALEGAEAGLDSLQARKGILIHRQVELEKRLRALQEPAN